MLGDMVRPHPLARPILIACLTVPALVLAACGVDGGDAPVATASPTAAVTDDPTAPAEPTASPTSVGTATPSGGPTATASEGVGLGQPVLWPAPDVVLATPEEAAAGFVEEVLDTPPSLGELQQGDARSGEIEVLSPGEGGGTPVPRGTLLLRQLGPDDGWYVIGAVSDVQRITAPEALAEVPAGPLAVEGEGRGFEATLIVSAHLPGEAEPVAQAIAQGGAFADPEPFSVTLDLSGVEPGQTVGIVVRGGTGLETDPGDVAAIPVVIGP